MKKLQNKVYPKISIVTVCYNSAKFLEEAINSVVIQDYPNIEYIVVDGGSTDGTVAIIQRNEQYIEKWISEPDGGIYDAMNKGIDMASGDYIAFLNSDDWYNEGVISHIAGDIRQKKAPIFCYEANRVGKNTSVLYRGKRKADDIRFQMIHCHQGVFAERSLFEKYERFNMNYKMAADYEWLLRMYNNGVNIEYMDFVVVNFRLGGVSSIYALASMHEAQQVALEAMEVLKEEKRIGGKYYSELTENIEKYYKEGECRIYLKKAVSENLFANNREEFLKLKYLLPKRVYSIFGCGILGKECLSLLEQLGYLITCFWDNEKNNWGRNCNGYVVRPPSEIKKGASLIVVSAFHYEGEINKQLEEMGLEKGIDFISYNSLRIKIGMSVKEYYMTFSEHENEQG